MILTAALAVTVLALLWVMDRQAKRHHEENQAHRLEIAALCQRIQAPETAVLQHAAEFAPDREAPLFHNEFSDDEQSLMDVLGAVEDR